jgi:mannose-1-phosphate guanylyltransferase/mannose-6-phosphate isomerase
MLEPLARNTAPAIALAAIFLKNSNHENDIMLVLPSDHVISDTKVFSNAIEIAHKAASNGKLVTFGIVPTHPETGYGYIKASKEDGSDALPVEKFVEKPSSEVAEQYIQSGDYYWNSGMFMFKVSTFIDELKQFEPDMYRFCEEAVKKAKNDLDFCRVDMEAFEKCPSNSIDYALMEKTNNAVIVPLDAGWNDVGAWPAVWQIQQKDSDGNAGKGDFIAQQSKNNYIHSEHRLVTLLGVDDLVVVETSDAILVADKNKAQDVKKIVDELSQKNRKEAKIHRKVYRPWGAFDSIDDGQRFQVKHITVKPGEKLSLQMHHHRAEHWIVVSGTAKVQIGDEVKMISENQSVYIPIGTKHSLENPGKLPLDIIEVQTGSYLGEDDIVRFEDRYGRN